MLSSLFINCLRCWNHLVYQSMPSKDLVDPGEETTAHQEYSKVTAHVKGSLFEDTGKPASSNRGEIAIKENSRRIIAGICQDANPLNSEALPFQKPLSPVSSGVNVSGEVTLKV